MDKDRLPLHHGLVAFLRVLLRRVHEEARHDGLSHLRLVLARRHNVHLHATRKGQSRGRVIGWEPLLVSMGHWGHWGHRQPCLGVLNAGSNNSSMSVISLCMNLPASHSLFSTISQTESQYPPSHTRGHTHAHTQTQIRTHTHTHTLYRSIIATSCFRTSCARRMDRDWMKFSKHQGLLNLLAAHAWYTASSVIWSPSAWLNFPL